MAEESLRTMTNKELLEQLSKLSPAQLERRATLYDTLSGHLYNPKEVIHIDEKDTSTEKFDGLNLPIFDCDVVIISF